MKQAILGAAALAFLAGCASGPEENADQVALDLLRAGTRADVKSVIGSLESDKQRYRERIQELRGQILEYYRQARKGNFGDTGPILEGIQDVMDFEAGLKAQRREEIEFFDPFWEYLVDPADRIFFGSALKRAKQWEEWYISRPINYTAGGKPLIGVTIGRVLDRKEVEASYDGEQVELTRFVIDTTNGTEDLVDSISDNGPKGASCTDSKKLEIVHKMNFYRLLAASAVDQFDKCRQAYIDFREIGEIREIKDIRKLSGAAFYLAARDLLEGPLAGHRDLMVQIVANRMILSADLHEMAHALKKSRPVGTVSLEESFAYLNMLRASGEHDFLYCMGIFEVLQAMACKNSIPHQTGAKLAAEGVKSVYADDRISTLHDLVYGPRREAIQAADAFYRKQWDRYRKRPAGSELEKAMEAIPISR